MWLQQASHDRHPTDSFICCLFHGLSTICFMSRRKFWPLWKNYLYAFVYMALDLLCDLYVECFALSIYSQFKIVCKAMYERLDTYNSCILHVALSTEYEIFLCNPCQLLSREPSNTCEGQSCGCFEGILSFIMSSADCSLRWNGFVLACTFRLFLFFCVLLIKFG